MADNEGGYDYEALKARHEAQEAARGEGKGEGSRAKAGGSGGQFTALRKVALDKATTVEEAIEVVRQTEPEALAVWREVEAARLRGLVLEVETAEALAAALREALDEARTVRDEVGLMREALAEREGEVVRREADIREAVFEGRALGARRVRAGQGRLVRLLMRAVDPHEPGRGER